MGFLIRRIGTVLFVVAALAVPALLQAAERDGNSQSAVMEQVVIFTVTGMT
jgi:hypothetical protein